MTTLKAGTAAVFTTVTTYSSCAPGMAGPPPTTETWFEIESCWPAPTTTTVGCGPFAGLPSPSVSRLGCPVLVTTAWLLIRVLAGVPGSTRRSYCRVAAAPGEIVPAPGPGSGGVRSDEEMLMPEASGATPPSGCPTGRPLRSVVFAT